MHPALRLAKNTLKSIFTGKTITTPAGLEEHKGCFVTINKHGALRGCIGFVTSDRPLKETIPEAARSAALHDPRFPPLQEDELDDIKVEVSVLSEPHRVNSEDPLRRQEAFKAGSTGLIAQRGWKSGLLLPQVFEKDTPAAEALTMTCEKAGLPPQAWKEKETAIYTFTAEHYQEPTP